MGTALTPSDWLYTFTEEDIWELYRLTQEGAKKELMGMVSRVRIKTTVDKDTDDVSVWKAAYAPTSRRR